MKIKLDPWQKEFLETKGNKLLCTGRQSGKSFICSMDSGDYAAHNKNTTTLIVAPTERQAYNLFEKTLTYIIDNYPKLIKKGKDKPTKTLLRLTNGSKIYCLPVGIDAHGIRGMTINRLYIDEASRVNDISYNAITPMLLTTAGDIILMSTPFGRKGFFYEAYKSETFNKLEISSEEVIAKREICETWTELQKIKALEYLEREKERMTRLEYSQEYLGQFVEDLMQFFPDNIILACQKRKRNLDENKNAIIDRKAVYYLGVDVGGRGGDDSVLTIINGTKRDKLIQEENFVIQNELTTQTERDIIHQNTLWRFRRIYIDSAGLGVGIYDHLLELDSTKRAVVSIENAKRSLDHDDRRTKKLMKEDLYNNLLCIMERGEIELLDDPEIFQSLKSVQFEICDDKSIKIFGRYTHIAEALVRAAWCKKDKGLNIWIK